jgi:hypothetical protein
MTRIERPIRAKSQPDLNLPAAILTRNNMSLALNRFLELGLDLADSAHYGWNQYLATLSE